MILRKFEILYSEGDFNAAIYLPLYGSLRLWHHKWGIVCANIGSSMCVGEEAINNSSYTHREDNCFAEKDTAIFCIERAKWIEAREKILYDAYT